LIKQYALTSIVCFLILLFRFPLEFSEITFIYEDGSYFYKQHILSDSFLLFSPFAPEFSGEPYYLFTARLIFTFVVSFLPISFAPYVVNLLGLAVFALSVSSIVFLRSLIYSYKLRIAFSILITSSIHSFEWLANASNLFWVLKIPLIVLFLSFPKFNKQKIYKNILILLLGFFLAISTPLSVFLLPLFLFNLFVVGWKRLINLVGVLIGIFLQLQNTSIVSNQRDLSEVIETFVNFIPLKIVFPSIYRFTQKPDYNLYITQFYLGYFLIFSLLILIFLFKKKGDNYRVFYALYFIFISTFISIYSRGLSFSYEDLLVLYSGTRYLFIPCICFVYLILLLFYRMFKENSIKILFLFFLPSIYFNFYFFPAFKDYNLKSNWEENAKQISIYMENMKLSKENNELIIPIFKFPFQLVLPKNTKS